MRRLYIAIGIAALVTSLFSGCVGKGTRGQGGGGRIGKGEPIRITLVVGGAGIASFATVGILKRLQEEGVQVESIVATGWPAIFSVAYGFSRSIHDLEWFAMRMQEKDLFDEGLFGGGKDFASSDPLIQTMAKAFSQRELQETKLPVILSAVSTERGEPEIFSKGDWKSALLKAVSIPGISRPYSGNVNRQWISSLQGLDVEEAFRQGGKTIVAVNMYADYLDQLRGSRRGSSEGVFREIYLSYLQKNMAQQLAKAHYVLEVRLQRSPRDFGAKRSAILAGEQEAARWLSRVRSE